MKQIHAGIETNASTDPVDFIAKAGIVYRSMESFYHPIEGWRVSLDHGIVCCDENNKTITYYSKL